MTTTVTRRAHDYELTVDGVRAGHLSFVEDAGTVVLTHTVVDDAVAGQGLAGTLTREVLDDLRARGLAVVPQCPFVAAWIGKHPDYADLVR